MRGCLCSLSTRMAPIATQCGSGVMPSESFPRTCALVFKNFLTSFFLVRSPSFPPLSASPRAAAVLMYRSSDGPSPLLSSQVPKSINLFGVDNRSATCFSSWHSLRCCRTVPITRAVPGAMLETTSTVIRSASSLSTSRSAPGSGCQSFSKHVGQQNSPAPACPTEKLKHARWAPVSQSGFASHPPQNKSNGAASPHSPARQARHGRKRCSLSLATRCASLEFGAASFCALRPVTSTRGISGPARPWLVAGTGCLTIAPCAARDGGCFSSVKRCPPRALALDFACLMPATLKVSSGPSS